MVDLLLVVVGILATVVVALIVTNQGLQTQLIQQVADQIAQNQTQAAKNVTVAVVNSTVNAIHSSTVQRASQFSNLSEYVKGIDVKFTTIANKFNNTENSIEKGLQEMRAEYGKLLGVAVRIHDDANQILHLLKNQNSSSDNNSTQNP